MGDAAFLLRIGWTWEQYMATPDDVIEKMLILLRAEAEASKEAMENVKHG